MPELDRRKIDRDPQRARPRRSLAAGLAQDPFADRNDQAALLGERNECPGGHHAARRIAPANERLKSDEVAVDGRLRLKMKREFIVCEGRAQFVLKRPFFAQPHIHFDVEEPRPAAAFGLGAIERRVGVGDQRDLVGAVLGKDRDADAQAGAQLVAGDLQFARHRRVQSIGERLGDHRLRMSGGDQRELVAANPGEEGSLGGRAQSRGDRLQQPIPHRMPEDVVDFLEAVEIDADHREILARGGGP